MGSVTVGTHGNAHPTSHPQLLPGRKSSVERSCQYASKAAIGIGATGAACIVNPALYISILSPCFAACPQGFKQLLLKPAESGCAFFKGILSKFKMKQKANTPTWVCPPIWGTESMGLQMRGLPLTSLVYNLSASLKRGSVCPKRLTRHSTTARAWPMTYPMKKCRQRPY